MLIKRLLLTLFVIFLSLGILSGFLYYYLVHWGEFSVFRGRDSFEKQMLNILVVGADVDYNNISRSDTIFFVNIDLNHKGIGLISIPRDTKIIIPGRSSYEKMNAAYAHGGINLIKRTVEEFLKVEIDYYFDIDYQSFEGIIDLLGGVELEIPYHMYYVDRAGGLFIDIPPGRQILDGEKALHFVRYREPIEADIGRIKRQQYLMESLLKSLFQTGTIPKIPALVQGFWDTIKTDMTYTDMAQFVNLARYFDLNRIEMEMVPGRPDETDTYWLAHREELQVMVENLIYSKEYLENRKIGIAIYNGNGKPGLATEVAHLMEMKGFTILHRSNARHYDYQETKILYQDEDHLLRIQGYFKGKSLCFEKMEDSYYVFEGADLIIILGHDYKTKG